MYILKALIAPMLIIIGIPVVFWFFMYFKERGEEKISSEEVIRTCPPKIVSGFFLGFALIMLLGGIAAIIYSCLNREDIDTAVITFVLIVIAIFSFLGFFGYVYVRFNYVVVDNEGILSCRLFGKKKYYKYEDIAYFKDTTDMGMQGGLVGYNKDNKKIFSIEAVHIGVSIVAQRLRDHGVQEK